MFGVRHLDGTLAALKVATSGGGAGGGPGGGAGGGAGAIELEGLSEPALGWALNLGRKAVRILSVTHGQGHELTRVAGENVQLVEGLMAMRAARVPTGLAGLATKAAGSSGALGESTAVMASAPGEVGAPGAAHAPSAVSARRTRQKKQKARRNRKGGAAPTAVDGAAEAEAEAAAAEAEADDDEEEADLSDLDRAVSSAGAVLASSSIEAALLEVIDEQTQLALRRAALLEELAALEAKQHAAAQRREVLMSAQLAQCAAAP